MSTLAVTNKQQYPLKSKRPGPPHPGKASRLLPNSFGVSGLMVVSTILATVKVLQSLEPVPSGSTQGYELAARTAVSVSVPCQSIGGSQ